MGADRKVPRGEIQGWLLARISSIVGVPSDQIDPRAPFSRYGLDSLGAIDLVASLAEWLDRELAPTLLWDCPNILALSEHLAGPDSSAETSGASDADTVPSPPPRDEPIAIVGIGCRFPGAPDVEAFWRLLCEGVNAIREVPADRWDSKAFTSPDAAAPGKMTSNLGGFLDRIDAFDHAFFGISPREAARMDPQQRLLLEVAWEALEDAGLPPERLEGSKTGVFVGVLTSDYADMALASPRHIDAYSGTGSLACIAANRISYAFNFAGPSLAIDAACSSSLVAVHMACESIRRGECEAALAGGVNAIALPTHALVMTKAGALSPDGRCYSFDARANGYVRGEGSGIVVLKALSRALADGDPIYAVIRGSAVNHGGRSNGLTAPRQGAQEELLRDAYRAAGVSPADVLYVEAHGTGTPLGDPIECKALGAVLAEGRGDGSKCAIGSVKTNIGHLEAAAGVAGLIKVALAIKHGEIPASLNFEKPNPHIPFDSLPLRVQAKRGPWGKGSKIAGVSSFGLGGTNAHVVLEEAPPRSENARPPSGKGRWGRAALGDTASIIPLSAHSPEALRALAAAGRRAFSDLDPGALPDLSHTAGLRRQHHDIRAALIVKSREELLDALSALSRDESRPSIVKAAISQGSAANTNTNKNTNTKDPVFVFSGQGPQWFAMGRGLMKTEPVFREVMEACDALVREHGGFSLLEELRADEKSSRVHESHVVQPALFAIQIALAALWKSYGVEPGAVLGHSGGEIAAAYVAGVIELGEAVRLSVRRGKIMASAIGRTAAVALSPEDALKEIKRCNGRVSIAAINSPTATTLSGDAEPLDALLESLDRRGIFARALRVKCAAHSHLLEGAKEELRAAIADLAPKPPRVPIVSTLTGEMAGPDAYTPAYWARQMREPVLFAKAVGTLADQGFRVFLELNPHPVLAGSIAECFGWRGEKPLVIPSLRRGEDDRTTLLAAIGAVYTAGYSIEWRASLRVFEADRPEGFEVIRFPLYPWQRERCWLEPELLAALRSGERGIGGDQPSGHPLLGRHTRSASASGLMLWDLDIDRSTLSYIDDHKVQEARVFQSLTYVEMVLAAAHQALGEGPFAVSNIAFRRALFVPDEGRRTIRLELLPAPDGGATFSIYSRPAEETSAAAFTLHVTGSLTLEEGDRFGAVMAGQREILARCREELSGEAFYEKLRSLGNQYGPRFQGVAKIARREGEALGEIRVPELLKAEVPTFAFHPAVLDACGQVLLAADREGGGFMPVVIDRIRVLERPGERLFSHVEIRGGAGGDELVGDVRVYAEDGRLIAEMLGSHLQYLDRIGAQRKVSLDNSVYEIAWRPAANTTGAPAPRESSGAWVVLADRGGVGEGLAARLRQGGQRCVVVQKGERFAELGRDRFAMSEGARDDIRRIFERLGADGGPGVAGAVHLFSLDAPGRDLLSAQGGGSASYLMLLQEASRMRKPPRVWAVTRGAQAARPGEALPGLAATPLWGLGRTAALELPSVWGGLIDLDPKSSEASAIEALAKEIERPGREDQIAFRGVERLAARLVRREARTPRSIGFRPDASYLVTGGLGSLGLKVARWMAEQGARRLILMGRTPLPPRSQWRGAAPGSRLAEQVAEIRAMESLGVSVVTAAVDVADENALRAFLDHYENEGWPAIRGVVHAAGVAGLCPLVELSASALDADLRGKAVGALLLDRLLGDLDFCVYYSSLSSILASPLLGGYAAANSFLDALAHDRRARGKRALSLNWGFWAEGGMASRHTAEQGRRAMPRGMDEFSPEQALSIQGRLLREDASQVMIGVVDWTEYGASYPAAAALPLFDELLRGPEAAANAKPQAVRETHASKPLASGEKPKLSRAVLLGEVPEARLQRVVEFLGAEVARVLRIPVWKMETHVPLSNLGIDSMMATELKNGIEASIGVVLPLVRFLKGPTVHDLAGDIMSSLPSEPELTPAASRVQAVPSLVVRPPPLEIENGSEEPEGLGDLARAEDLLRRIDHLSDDEVSLLLEQMLEGGAECA